MSGQRITGALRKFFDLELDYESPLTESTMLSIGAALNALCDFADVRCELFTTDGIFQASPQRSQILIIGIGGGGGGGSGARGSIRSEAGVSTVLEANGANGINGTSGTNSTFGGFIVGNGGRLGVGGQWLFGQSDEVNQDIYNIQSRNANLMDSMGAYFNGAKYGSGGIGSQGSLSRVYNHGTSNFDRFEYRETGTRGFSGNQGELGFYHLIAVPNSNYNVVVGQGGIGASPNPAASITIAGNDRFSGAVQKAADGIDGAVLAIEFGY